MQEQFISREEINYIFSFLSQIRSLSSLVLNFLIWESISFHWICFSGGCIFIFWILDTLFTTACSLETFALQGFSTSLSTQNFIVKMTDKGSEWQAPVGQSVITTHFDFTLLLFSILSAHSLIIVGDCSEGTEHSALGGQGLISGWKWLTTGWRPNKNTFRKSTRGIFILMKKNNEKPSVGRANLTRLFKHICRL